jgi:hypothetical protein
MTDEPQGNFGGYEPVTKALYEQVRERDRRIAELEAERDGLREALKPFKRLDPADIRHVTGDVFRAVMIYDPSITRNTFKNLIRAAADEEGT